MPNLPIVAPRVPLTDPRTGLISREWYRFLMDQSTLTGGSALTRTNDSNVTLTLGGSPLTALLAPVSLTLGWTGQLPIARGGTGAATAADARTALGAAAATHAHAVSDVTGLQTALDGKAATGHNHAGVYEPVLGYTPVNKAGDTMSGPLTLAGDPTNNLGAATKQYVDSAIVSSPSGLVAADIVTVPDGAGSFALVFTDAGDVIAVD